MLATQLTAKHILSIKELSLEDIALIFKTADQFKEVVNRPIKKVPALRDLTIATVFFENSTRTRISFELAAKRLSAEVINFSAHISSLQKGETLLDTVNNILAMKVDILIVRHVQAGTVHFLAEHVNARIINAGDGMHEHPTQALQDAYTIQQKLGTVQGKKIAIIGDVMHSRVALSNIFIFQKLGAEVMVCGPPTLLPIFIAKLGIKIEYDIKQALIWCDVAYVLRAQLERQKQIYFPSLREYTLYYGINKKLLAQLPKAITIMHPGPINRGIELHSDVIDTQHTIVLEQVENGMIVRMAILYLLAQSI